MRRMMIMQTVIFNVDTTNQNGVISKEHGNMIERGTEISFEEVPGNVQRLVKIGVAAIKEDQAASITDNDPDPSEDPQDPGETDETPVMADEPPDRFSKEELEEKKNPELKSIADAYGIEYKGNESNDSLIEKIISHYE
jgi:hypothetical protein